MIPRREKKKKKDEGGKGKRKSLIKEKERTFCWTKRLRADLAS